MRDSLVSPQGAQTARRKQKTSQKVKGTLARPPWSLVLRAYLLFLAALFAATFFRTTFAFFSCHIFYSPFPFSWICGPKKKTAIDECLELLKIEVKKKTEDFLDGSFSGQRVHHHQQTFPEPLSLHRDGNQYTKALNHAAKTHLCRTMNNRTHARWR